MKTTKFIKVAVPKRWFEEYRKDIAFNTCRRPSRVSNKQVVESIIEDTKQFPG